MYEKFKTIQRAAEQVGKIEKMTMYETYASIDLVDKDGNKVSLTMSITEGLKNDAV
jgi:hypothetical protein